MFSDRYKKLTNRMGSGGGWVSCLNRHKTRISVYRYLVIWIEGKVIGLVDGMEAVGTKSKSFAERDCNSKRKMYLSSDLRNVKYPWRSVQFCNSKIISRNWRKIPITVFIVGFNRYLFKMKLKEFWRNLILILHTKLKLPKKY